MLKRRLKNRTRANGRWTEARYFSFIRSALRMAWIKYPVKYDALKLASKPNTGEFDNRTKNVYTCANCKNVFKVKDVQVDHKISVGTLRTYDDLPRFVANLFCELNNLQVLCKDCHKEKTNKERKDDGRKK